MYISLDEKSCLVSDYVMYIYMSKQDYFVIYSDINEILKFF